MGDDEVGVLIVSGLTALVAWLVVIGPAFSVAPPRTGRWVRHALAGAVFFGLIGLFTALLTVSSFDVKSDPTYITMYGVMGAAWVGVGLCLLPRFGLSLRDDVIERHNPAAAVVIAGAALAITACYTGGNIGDGPGWWVVVFAGLLASGALAVLWVVLNKLTHIVDRITIDRDVGTAARTAGLLVAWGLVLGRASAGNWISAVQTVIDFGRMALPAVGFLVVDVAIARGAGGALRRPALGIGIGAVFVGLATAWVLLNRPVG